MSTPTRNIDWLLQNFISNSFGVISVVVTSSDGLLIASENLDDNATTGLADLLSALASGVHSLAKGASRRLHAGHVSQTLIQMGQVNMYIMEAGDGAILTVMGKPDADPGQLSYEMSLLIQQMPQNLSVPERMVSAGSVQAPR
ncbi:roadblock/LC7 domain-containing protein [Streptomyces sp. Go40/10]|uniref:roadblock/LC7 domain-containing protein n=1 Tax=Streptomyces sp. Go40/10 TaxID=2825844 RepID=UPI001E2CD248|nr:roadblock/LC7 domain-containing protein [Streptomyces sp. Go40/10]UFQ99781.1 roadblock/LC7 domain-containing protein [Streptomyces sp. Go40/10]